MAAQLQSVKRVGKLMGKQSTAKPLSLAWVGINEVEEQKEVQAGRQEVYPPR
jgi:hypothetical protein